MLRETAGGNRAVVVRGQREIAPIPKAVRPMLREIVAVKPAAVVRDLQEIALIRAAATDVPNGDKFRPLHPRRGRKRITRVRPNHRKVKPDNRAVSWR